jgi:hypothetical protein
MSKLDNRTIVFTVTGRGEFPFDMLRYDQCYPVGPTDAAMLAYDNRKKTREITLARRRNLPAVQRWVSFGWACSGGRELK